jgi:hypothetical protein
VSVARLSAIAKARTLSWVLLAIVFGSLAALLVSVLLRIANEEDRTARRTQRKIDPFSDVTRTRTNSMRHR